MGVAIDSTSQWLDPEQLSPGRKACNHGPVASGSRPPFHGLRLCKRA